MVFTFLIIVYLLLNLDQKHLNLLVRLWDSRLCELTKLVCVFQAGEFTWLSQYATFAYRNAVSFRNAIEIDVGDFKKVFHGYQVILNYRIFGMKTIIGELLLVRILTETLTPEDHSISFCVDGVMCLYVAICWVLSAFIVKTEHFTLWGIKAALSTSTIFQQICSDYWERGAKIYEKSSWMDSYFAVIETEKLKNFFAVAQLGVLGICCLVIFGDHFVRIARYLN